MREILNDPHMRSRGVVGHFDHPTAGRVPALRTPLRLDGFQDPEPDVPPPLLGADTAPVLRDWLGMAEADIDALRQQKAI